MSDPSIDPSLARPLDSSTQQQDNTHLQGVPSHDIFKTTYEGGLYDDPAAYQLATQVLQNAQIISARDDGTTTSAQGGNKSAATKSKKNGPLIRKRSGWNAFYKEQFAIYHANNPPATKQNARERTGFSSYASEMWKQLSPAQKEVYARQAAEDDTLAVSRPVEKLRRKRAGLLDTLGRVIAELEAEFGVESLMFWSERAAQAVQPDGSVPVHAEGESFGIVGSSAGSKFIELMSHAQLGPQQFMMFIQQNQPPTDRPDDVQQNLVLGAHKRKRSSGAVNPDFSGFLTDDGDTSTSAHLKKMKTKQNISRDYHDAEFRRLLLALLNNNLPPQSQKTRLPRGFFGPYLAKHGLELVGLPERPVEIGDGGKIGGWSAEALRKNLEAVRGNRVFIRRVEQQPGEGNTNEMMDITVESIDDEPEDEVKEEEGGAGGQEEEAARILTEGAGNRRGRGRRGGLTA